MCVGTAIELHGTSGNGGGSGTAIHFASGKKSWYVSNRYRMLRRKRLREEGRGGRGRGGGEKKSSYRRPPAELRLLYVYF